MGGRIDGSRRASIVFPQPGGPTKSRLCPPAAAISSARFAASCPRTSARSPCTSVSEGSRAGACVRRRHAPPLPRITATAFCSESTAYSSMPSTSAASSALRAGTINLVKPALRAPITMGKMPLTGRSAPSRASSPSAIKLWMARRSICSSIASSARAIARSNAGPTLRTSAGERLTRSRPAG